MKNVKYFNHFMLEKKIPDLKLDITDILSPLKDNKVDMYTTFELDADLIKLSDNIGELFDDNTFNNFLAKKKLKKGKLEDTIYSETFIKDRYVLRFFFVYDKDSIIIEEPIYILIQYLDKNNNKLSDIMVFLNKDNTINFYETLTDASIELIKGKKSYVYNSHNSGNNWELMNPDLVSNKFKVSLDYDEMQDLLNDKTVKIQ